MNTIDDNSWVKLYRKMVTWRWFTDVNTTHFFLYCLFTANWEDKDWKTIKIPKGSFVSNLSKMSVESGLSVKSIRTAIKKLVQTGEIEQKGANSYTMITICNYDKYQDVPIAKGQTKGKQGANEGQTKGKQGATTKEYKEEEELNNNNIKKYSPKGEYKEIADLWHSICTSLPKVRMITDARRAKIKSRLGEFGDDPMVTLRTIFEKIQASDFCKGDNDRHWQADFDWVFENDTNWVKVVEGKYDNMQPTKTDYSKYIY